MVMNPRVVNVLGLTHNTRHCERSEAIQKCSQRKDWIAAPPAEARNDVLRKSYVRFWGGIGSLALIVLLSACSLATKPAPDPLAVSHPPKHDKNTDAQWQTYATEAAFGSLKTQLPSTTPEPDVGYFEPKPQVLGKKNHGGDPAPHGVLCGAGGVAARRECRGCRRGGLGYADLGGAQCLWHRGGWVYDGV